VTVSVVDTSNDTVVATIPISSRNPDGAAVSPDGTLVYVASEGGIVSVISTATNSVVATIPVGSGAIFVAFSPDGSLAYVTHYGGDYVSVINTATNTVVVDITLGGFTYSVAFSPDGSHAYVTNEGSGAVSVIDTANNSIVTSIVIGSSPTGIAVSPDGTHVYASNYGSGTVSVIDTATNTVTATINLGTNPYGVVVSPDGLHAYVATYPVTYPGMGPGGTVAVIDTATNSVTTSIDVGPSVGITISPDGSHVYVSHYTSGDTVTVIDTATNSVIDTITVGTGGEYLAISGSAPVTATPDRAHVDLNHTLSVNGAHGVLANDTDLNVGDSLIVSAVNGSAANVGQSLQGLYGSINIHTDGSYTYAASGALPGDGVGFDTFTYTAEDGLGGTSSSEITVVVVSPTEHYFGGIAGQTIDTRNFKTGGQVLDGGAGHDVLLSGKSASVLIGGPNDTLTGSINAADKFVFHDTNFGHNEITNFNPTNDTIWFDHTLFTNFKQIIADSTQVGANVVINDGHGDVVQLDNVKLSALHSSDFHFA